MTVTATTSCYTAAAGLPACMAARKKRMLSLISEEPRVTMDGQEVNFADLVKPSKVSFKVSLHFRMPSKPYFVSYND